MALLVLAFYHPVLLAFDVRLRLSVGVIVFGRGQGAVRTSID